MKQSGKTAGVALLLLLLLLTLLALLPVAPQGPFDARDYRPAQGVELDFPATGALIEPLLAVGMALAGEPDVRIACLSTLVWLIILAAGFSLYRQDFHKLRPKAASLFHALLAGTAAAGLFLSYIGFTLLVPLPGWKLNVTDPDLIVADLQTHTIYSHDGLATPSQNLALHRARGFDVVAFTEHDNLAGTLASTSYSYNNETLPYAIIATEVREPGRAFMLSIGWLPLHDKWTEQWLQNLDKQPVIALAWKLSVADVHRLAANGLTGFEIANAGHPDIPPEVRNAILSEAEKRNLVLVASSDWHGWGGFWRTWTTVRVPDAAQLTRAEQAQAVVTALQQRRSQDIQPVVAGYLGPPSLLQTLFAPISALLRYGMELSPFRVVMWWLWGGLALLLGWWLQKSGLRPARIMVASLLGLFGTGMMIQGIRMLTLTLPGMTAGETLTEVGGWGTALGGLSLLAALIMAGREFLVRARRNQTSR